MSMQAHVAELERRHEALDKTIRQETAHPSTDAVHLADLKRRKLILKDEIARLKGTFH